MIIFAGLIGAAGLGFLVSGLLTLLRVPKYYRKTRTAALRRIRTGIILFLLAVVSWNSIDDLRQTAEPAPGYSEYAEEILLDDERWIRTDDTERVKILEAYANQKAKELGIAHSLELVREKMDKDVRAYYVHREHRIYINEDCIRLSMPVCLVEIVAHEVRHAYQFNLAEAYMEAEKEYQDLLLFQTAEAYASGFLNYIEAEDDYDGYFSQNVEADAREYAAEQAIAFFICDKEETEEE